MTDEKFTVMIGKLEGDAAKQFSVLGYMYLVPRKPSVEEIVNTYEYRKFIGKENSGPKYPHHRVYENVDYTIQIYETDNFLVKKIEVWLLPNELSKAKKPYLIARCFELTEIIESTDFQSFILKNYLYSPTY